MKYRDNDVYFNYAANPENDYWFQGASLLVQGLAVTGGQDPDPRNRVGDVKIWEGGKMRFQVGRKGSGAVANWYAETRPGLANFL